MPVRVCRRRFPSTAGAASLQSSVEGADPRLCGPSGSLKGPGAYLPTGGASGRAGSLMGGHHGGGGAGPPPPLHGGEYSSKLHHVAAQPPPPPPLMGPTSGNPNTQSYPVHPDVRFKRLPFYDILAELHRPASLSECQSGVERGRKGDIGSYICRLYF